jgi:predicted dehydrogenase
LVTVPLEPADDRDAFELQFQNFVAAINGEAAPENDAQQAVYLMEMLDAIYLSSHLGREVPIA